MLAGEPRCGASAGNAATSRQARDPVPRRSTPQHRSLVSTTLVFHPLRPSNAVAPATAAGSLPGPASTEPDVAGCAVVAESASRSTGSSTECSAVPGPQPTSPCPSGPQPAATGLCYVGATRYDPIPWRHHPGRLPRPITNSKGAP